MKYRKIKKGKFIERPNRFIAYVNVEGEENNPQIVHVKNTGRCKELLVDNATVFLEESDNPNRKTKYDLVKVIKNGILINMDSQAPNKVVNEWLLNNGLFKNTELVKPEKTFEKSRFGFYKMFNMLNCSIAWSVRKHGHTVFFKSYAFNLNPGFLAIAFNIKVKS